MQVCAREEEERGDAREEEEPGTMPGPPAAPRKRRRSGSLCARRRPVGTSRRRRPRQFTEIRLNTRTGESTRRAVLPPSSQVNLEVGMVNRNMLGRKTRYAYLAVAEPWPKVSGFAKVDLATGELTKFEYGEGRFGGEPCFVPMDGAHARRGEDDGYVLSFVRETECCSGGNELSLPCHPEQSRAELD